MKNFELEYIINQKLKNDSIVDIVPNGLQVEGCSEIKSIVTGVTASQELLNAAVKKQVNAVIVHHGLFWKNEPIVIKGMKYKRISTLLKNDINLYSWHLPLDIHPQLGNNVQLASLLNISIKGLIEPLLIWGNLMQPMNCNELTLFIKQKLNRIPLCCSDNAPKVINRIALCSGAGQNFIDRAADFGVDGFITGECSEYTIHSAREQGLYFCAAGHHATEKGGIKALSNWIIKKYDLNVEFIDINNPA